MPGRFALVPSARNEMAGATLPPEAGGSRLRLSYTLEIQANGSPAPADARIAVEAPVKGPGDIIGFNRRIVSRVEPEQGVRGFEPSYFPFVEFVDADFPWRYTLDTAAGKRTRPWIVLLALEAGEFEFATQGRAFFPRIRVFSPAESLPDLSLSWAHAHVQVSLESGGVASVVASDPSAHFSRLFAPRKLKERTAYHLFLVPAYEAGRRAGLGEAGTADPFDAPAWQSGGATPVELPVYFQSRFTTNQLEDVETLLRRLRGVNAADVEGLGDAPRAWAGDPGYYPEEVYAGSERTFEIQGALRDPGDPVERYDTDPRLAGLLSDTLREVIEGERVGAADDGPDREDPLVAMPPYGWRFRNEKGVSAARAAANRWFDRINLDLKFRHAAGLGAEVVRRDQELFAKKCWEQYEEVLEANRRLQRLRFAEVMVERTTRLRFSRLPAEAAVALSEPLHAHVRVDGERSVRDVVRAGGVPTSFVGRSLRRLSSRRPVHVEGPPGEPPPVDVPTPRIPGDVTARRGTVERGTVERGTPGARRAMEPGLERQLGVLFGGGAFRGVSRPLSFAVPVGEVSSVTLADALAGKLLSLPAAKSASVVAGRVGLERETVEPVYRSPVVPLPLSRWLTEMEPDRILAGVGSLPDNTVSVFVENRLFVEAFMVGANHAMNNELRWREFPTDMRGTVFRRFWDRGRTPDDPLGDDIARIHTWTRPLGGNFAPADTDREADLVVVIRGDIVRKLGQLIVVLNEAEGSRWESGKGENHSPVFFGRIGPDVVYYGFDVSRAHILSPGVKEKAFLVLYEPMGRLRFGLDVATAAVRRERRGYENLSLPFPTATLGRSYDRLPSRAAVGAAAAVRATPASWDDLSWSHVQTTQSGYVNFGRTIRVATGDDHWGSNRTSASIARSFWQKPLAAVLPLSRVL